MTTLRSLTKYDVIDSGSVIIPNGEYAQFMIESLVFRVSFLYSDDSSQRLDVDMEKNDDGTDIMHIKAYNFHDAFFTTPSKMLAVANNNGRQLYLNFSVTSVNSNESQDDKLFFYTWLLEKQVTTVVKEGGADDNTNNK